MSLSSYLIQIKSSDTRRELNKYSRKAGRALSKQSKWAGLGRMLGSSALTALATAALGPIGWAGAAVAAGAGSYLGGKWGREGAGKTKGGKTGKLKAGPGDWGLGSRETINEDIRDMKDQMKQKNMSAALTAAATAGARELGPDGVKEMLGGAKTAPPVADGATAAAEATSSVWSPERMFGKKMGASVTKAGEGIAEGVEGAKSAISEFGGKVSGVEDKLADWAHGTTEIVEDYGGQALDSGAIEFGNKLKSIKGVSPWEKTVHNPGAFSRLGSSLQQSGQNLGQTIGEFGYQAGNMLQGVGQNVGEAAGKIWKGMQFGNWSVPMNKGGRVPNSNTDTVPAMLTPGEFVIRKEAVDAIGVDQLESLNKMGRRRGYQEGGRVSRDLKERGMPRKGAIETMHRRIEKDPEGGFLFQSIGRAGPNVHGGEGYRYYKSDVLSSNKRYPDGSPADNLSMITQAGELGPYNTMYSDVADSLSSDEVQGWLQRQGPMKKRVK